MFSVDGGVEEKNGGGCGGHLLLGVEENRACWDSIAVFIIIKLHNYVNMSRILMTGYQAYTGPHSLPAFGDK
ncbi:hypothetical protein MASR2M78_27710 [Treponema sp.]